MIRTVDAINSASPGEDRLQFGFGAVDNRGNTYFSADDYGCTGPDIIVGSNIFRIRSLFRNSGALNVIDNAGGSDAGATDWILVRSDDTCNTPSCVPSHLAGSPVYIGSNFNTQYAHESAPLTVTTTTTHRGTSPDHRGNVYFGKAIVYPDTVGTGCMLLKNAADETRIMGFWGVNADGSVNGNSQILDIPVTIADNADGEIINNITESIHYHSQVAFRGGNGQVAVGQDQEGRFLAATTMPIDESSSSDWPLECIVVARFTDPDDAGAVEWTLANWVDPWLPYGKEIYDGPTAAGGVAIGQVTTLDAVTGGLPFGPSVSGPCIDSVGNIWFISAVELYGEPESDFDVALLRAVYDPAIFGYELELVTRVGDVFFGQNSLRNYQINYLEIADSNSIGSGTVWSGNIVQDTWNGISTAGLQTQDPRTLGGLVFSAGILYDSNDDGEFSFDTGDEGYNVLMYVGAVPHAPGDVDGDGDVDSSDLSALLGAYGTGVGDPNYDPNADFDNDGDVDIRDLATLLGNYSYGT